MAALDLVLRRRPSGPTSTIGELRRRIRLAHPYPVDAEAHLCYSCEDVVREVPGQPVSSWKVPGKTAIPAGRYRIITTMSQRFGRRLPILLDVPGFSGIRLHPGNESTQTDGCILLGQAVEGDGVIRSRLACEQIQTLIETALCAGDPVGIEVISA